MTLLGVSRRVSSHFGSVEALPRRSVLTQVAFESRTVQTRFSVAAAADCLFIFSQTCDSFILISKNFPLFTSRHSHFKTLSSPLMNTIFNSQLKGMLTFLFLFSELFQRHSEADLRLKDSILLVSRPVMRSTWPSACTSCSSFSASASIVNQHRLICHDSNSSSANLCMH